MDWLLNNNGSAPTSVFLEIEPIITVLTYIAFFSWGCDWQSV